MYAVFIGTTLDDLLVAIAPDKEAARSIADQVSTDAEKVANRLSLECYGRDSAGLVNIFSVHLGNGPFGTSLEPQADGFKNLIDLS